VNKPNKLTIKKITLRDLDGPALEVVAGGVTVTCNHICPTQITCVRTCLNCAQ